MIKYFNLLLPYYDVRSGGSPENEVVYLLEHFLGGQLDGFLGQFELFGWYGFEY